MKTLFRRPVYYVVFFFVKSNLSLSGPNFFGARRVLSVQFVYFPRRYPKKHKQKSGRSRSSLNLFRKTGSTVNRPARAILVTRPNYSILVFSGERRPKNNRSARL